MKRINLLPPEQRQRASRERGLMYVIVGLVVLVVVLGAVYFQQRSQVSSRQNDLAGLQAQTQAVQARAAALQPYAQIEQARSQLTQTATSIYNARVDWSSIFEDVSLVIPSNVRLTAMNCTVPASMLPGAAAASTGASSSTSGAAAVTFTGVTYTPDDVAAFMTRLGLIPQLTNIQLTSTTGNSASSSSGTGTSTATPAPQATAAQWTFTITAGLRPYLTAPPTTALTAGGAQ